MCFTDDLIKDFIREQDTIGNCDYCDSSNVHVAETAEVGSFVREGLARAYESVDAAGVYWDSESKSYTAGEHAVEVIHNEGMLSENVYEAFEDSRLISDLLKDSAPGHADLKDGITDWLDGGIALLVSRNDFYGPDYNRYQSAWDEFKQTVQFHSRFFDADATRFREGLLQPVEEFFPALARTLPAGTSFYRARRVRGVLPADPWQAQLALGPPPIAHTTHGRMSPPGISYLYLSSTRDTAIAELRPNVGWNLWVAKFALRRSVRVLDCTKIPNVKIPSIFDETYHHDMRWIRDFFRRFSDEISQPPTSHDDLLEYVPTQVFAEFVRAKGFDGLRYRSSQIRPGTNLTLFCSPPHDSEHGYWPARPLFHEWVRLESVSTVSVTRAAYKVSSSESMSVREEDIVDPDESSPPPF